MALSLWCHFCLCRRIFLEAVLADRFALTLLFLSTLDRAKPSFQFAMRLPWRNSKTNTGSFDEVDDLALWLILHGLIELLLWILVRIELFPHSHHDCVHCKVVFVRKIDFFRATKNSVDLNGENFGDIFNFSGAWTAEINRVVRLSCVAEVFHQVYEIDSFRVTFLFHEFAGFRIFVEIRFGMI